MKHQGEQLDTKKTLESTPYDCVEDGGELIEILIPGEDPDFSDVFKDGEHAKGGSEDDYMIDSTEGSKVQLLRDLHRKSKDRRRGLPSDIVWFDGVNHLPIRQKKMKISNSLLRYLLCM